MLEGLYDLKTELDQKGILFCFCGPVSQDLIAELGGIIKETMKLDNAGTDTILQTFSILIEHAQNIIHYSAEKITTAGIDQSPDDIPAGIIAVGHENDYYYTICGNIVPDSSVPRIEEKLTKIQEMTREELRFYYKKQRRQEPETESRGAGLGFIEISRRASKPIEYKFRKLDNNFSFFTIKTYS
jgi:hypothetical protein